MGAYLDKDGAGIIAEKINELNKKTEGKYTKPEGGIPETDLSQEVKDKLNSGGGEQTYDTIISTQEEFDAWYSELDAGIYAGHSVLFLSGTYTRSDGKGLHLPETLYEIRGVGNVELRITSLGDVRGCMWYLTTPTTNEYSIKNISIYGSRSGKNIVGFYNCINLINCSAEVSATETFYSVSAIGFEDCVNLFNCISSPTAHGKKSNTSYAFNSCTNLFNCTGTANSNKGSDGYSIAFINCINLISCNGTAYASGTSGSGTTVNTGYTFSKCNMCSNCIQTPRTTSKTATWNDNCTNVDPDTCPEYEGGGTSVELNVQESGEGNVVTSVEASGTDITVHKDSTIPRPTYFKLNGTPMTDTGGVGTKYTIATSNLTPSLPAPIVGDTVIFYTDSYTYIGTVTETQSSAVVAEVKVTMLGAAGGGGSGSGGGGGTQYYDTVIGSQEDFDAWLDELYAGTYNKTSVLILGGKYSLKKERDRGIPLAKTIFKIVGFPSAEITVEGELPDAVGQSGAMMYYEDGTARGSIENIALTGLYFEAGYEYGFKNCRNLKSCSASARECCFLSCINLENCSVSGARVGYSGCKNLYNCGGQVGHGEFRMDIFPCYGFALCENLNNCSILAYPSTGTAVAFSECKQLTNCYGKVECFPEEHDQAAAFEKCSALANCYGYAKGAYSRTITGYTFVMCKMCVNCYQDPNNASDTATWASNNTYVSKDTCPEYTG